MKVLLKIKKKIHWVPLDPNTMCVYFKYHCKKVNSIYKENNGMGCKLTQFCPCDVFLHACINYLYYYIYKEVYFYKCLLINEYTIVLLYI